MTHLQCASRCGPPGTAILRIWSCALSLAAAVARFATGKLEQLADCASLVTWPGRDRLRHLEPLETLHNRRHCWRNELEASVSPDTPLLLAGTAWGRRWRLKPADFWSNGGLRHRIDYFRCHARICISERQLSHRDDADFIAELMDYWRMFS